MNRKKLKQRLFTLLGIVGALVLTVGVAPRIFIADTPQIDPQVLANLGRMPSDFVAFVTGNNTSVDEPMIASIEETDVPEGASFEPFAKGVYAAEDPATGQSYVKFEAGTELQVYEVQLEDGRMVTIYVPVE